MLVKNFSRISSKKLGFVAGFVITKNSKSFSVCIWSPRGIFGSLYFNSFQQALSFCQFLGVPTNPVSAQAKQPVPTNKQISLFN